MTRIGVVLPTVTGREALLDLAIRSHCPPWAESDDGVTFALGIEKDLPTCARAWTRSVERLLPLELDYLLISADDFEARGPWWRNAITVCDAGGVACPLLFNHDCLLEGGYFHQGECPQPGRGESERWESSNNDGEPGEPAACTRSPTLFTASQASSVFALFCQLPEMQYYGDFLLGDIAHRLGFQPVVADGFSFVHHWGQPGRHTDAQNEADHGRYLQALTELDELCRSTA